MSEKPLERLNYFNGQRLQAGDFKLEQEYHLRVRRWLNRSLYTSGIAMGLEVYAVAGAPRVRVNPGLALDPMGREIILLEAREVPVMHDIGQGGGMDGPYLVIRYDETLLAQQDACCVPGAASDNKAAQGGPSRVLADPVLECVPDLPLDGSARIVLGRIVLADGCGSIASIDTSVRRYVGEATAAKVRQYALEGVRDLDPANPATLFFHVRGRQPNSIALYLRAQELPTMYYTEMGRHTHGLTVDLALPPHTHKLFDDGDPNATGPTRVSVKSITADADTDIWQGVIATAGTFAVIADGLAAPLIATAVAGAEAVLFAADAFDPGTGMNLTLSPRPFRKFNGDNIAARVNMNIDIDANADGSHGHTHSVPRATKPYPEAGGQSVQGGGTGTSDAAGVDDTSVPYAARSGDPIHWVDGLEVVIDGVDCTAEILTQLRNRRPPGEDWTKLGNGSAGHTLALTGTDELRLDFLPGVTFGEGEHVIEIHAPQVSGKRNGGRIHYNLYVE